jgi:hypothetical protein
MVAQIYFSKKWPRLGGSSIFSKHHNNQKQVLQKRLKKAKRLSLVFVFQFNLKFLKNEKNWIITPNFRAYLSK